MKIHGQWKFTSGETAPGTHYMGSWVGPGAGLDVMDERSRESNPYTLVIQLVA